MSVKIGLEIHMYLKTQEKLFCRCKTLKQDSPTNSLICPICTGQPGSKPLLPNKTAIEHTLKLALIFGCKIIKNTHFNRKHYTWSDMPNGFQRTISGGNVKGNGMNGTFENVGISEIHLEEDPAAWNPETGEINYNRCGFPLVEIVTEPDFTSTEMLRKWLEELILVAKYIKCYHFLGIKADVNVSIKESNFTRVEIKNVNSFTSIVESAKVEIGRQRKVIKQRGEIKQETRRFNEEKNTTEFMRSKENAQDYMFIPEVDLPSLELADEIIENLKSQIPELPKVKREKYKEYNFDKETIEVLVSNLYLTEIFEYVISQKLSPREVGLFLRREILRVLNYHNDTFEDLERKDIKEELTNLIEMLGKGTISYTTAQRVLEKLYEENIKVRKYVEENNLFQVQDTELIEGLVKKALQNSPKAVEDYKSGNMKSLNFIIGIVMRETKGKAKPHIVQQILKKKLEELMQ